MAIKVKKATEQTGTEQATTEQLDLFEQLQIFIKTSSESEKIKTLLALAAKREVEILKEKEEKLLDSARDFLEAIETESIQKVLVYLLEKSGEGSGVIRTYLLQNSEAKESLSDLFKSKETRQTRTKWVSPDETIEYVRGKGEKPRDFDVKTWKKVKI